MRTWCGCAEPVGACGTSLTDWCSYHFSNDPPPFEGDSAALERWSEFVDKAAQRDPAAARQIIAFYGRL